MKKLLISDLSKITNVPEELLEKLASAAAYSIGEAVYESETASEDTTEIDLGFGTLLIKHSISGIKFKYLPNAAIEKDIVNIIRGKEPQLEVKLRNTLAAKLIAAYKDIL